MWDYFLDYTRLFFKIFWDYLLDYLLISGNSFVRLFKNVFELFTNSLRLFFGLFEIIWEIMSGLFCFKFILDFCRLFEIVLKDYWDYLKIICKGCQIYWDSYWLGSKRLLHRDWSATIASLRCQSKLHWQQEAPLDARIFFWPFSAATENFLDSSGYAVLNHCWCTWPSLRTPHYNNSISLAIAEGFSARDANSSCQDVGFICPFVVIDPTDLGATTVVARNLLQD